jgi:cytochrome oxidase assembly protein ShyY1
MHKCKVAKRVQKKVTSHPVAPASQQEARLPEITYMHVILMLVFYNTMESHAYFFHPFFLSKI